MPPYCEKHQQYHVMNPRTYSWVESVCPDCERGLPPKEHPAETPFQSLVDKVLDICEDSEKGEQMTATKEIKVGDELYRRGRRHSDPPEVLSHAVYIVGETRMSWLVSERKGADPQDPWHMRTYISKVSKRVLARERQCAGNYIDRESLEQDMWVGKHVYWISQQVSLIREYDKLRQIADIIGYKEETAK